MLLTIVRRERTSKEDIRIRTYKQAQGNQDLWQKFLCGCVAQRLASIQLKSIQIVNQTYKIDNERNYVKV